MIRLHYQVRITDCIPQFLPQLANQFTDSKLNPDAPNVLHMTVKPQEVVEEEDAKGGKASYGREPEVIERSPRCRCVIL